MISELTRTAIRGDSIDPAALEAALHHIMTGAADPVQVGGLLTALASQPLDARLVAAAARALREHRVAIHAQVRPLIDTCGTGGDGAGTFNISTAAALVVAAAGGAVAKHGNRGVSSAVGSADVLEAAGAQLELAPERAVQLLDATGFAFLFAPAFHPAMRHVAPVRRALGIRTLFNVLGPLANPALADSQLIGVYAPELTLVLAEALRELGSRSALVVHCAGSDGSALDEIGLHAPTIGHRLHGDTIEPFRLDPSDYGIAPAPLEALRGGDAARNVEILGTALAGETGPLADVVALNAGAALHVAGMTDSIGEGIERARAEMSAGSALRVLDRYVLSSRDTASTEARRA